MSEYTIIKPERNCGMCGYIWQVIRGIYENPNTKYYIDFSNSIYNFDDHTNVWDCFFEQPRTNSRPDPSNISSTFGISFNPISEFIYQSIQPNTPEEIQKRRDAFSDIIKKYFVLKPSVKNKIDDFYKKNFEGHRVLGVHFRGTDHPNKKPVHEYMQSIVKLSREYDKVFICSDEFDRFRLAEITFFDKAVSYDSLRSKNSNIPLHSDPSDPRYNRNGLFEYQHKIAEDVIIEAYLMSKVDFLACCPGSNVNYFARAINSKLNYVEL